MSKKIKSFEKMDFETKIREEINNLELKYEPQEWLRLEKDLPNTVVNSGFGKNITLKAVFALLIPAIAILSFFYFHENEKPVEKAQLLNTSQIEKQTVLPEKSEIISEKKIKPIVEKEIIESKKTQIASKVNKKQAESQNLKIKNSDSSEKLPEKKSEENIDNNQDIVSKKEILKEKTGFVPDNNFIVNAKEGCSPLTIRFSPLEKSDTIFYLWNFGDGQISTEIEPTHIYSNSGSFDVSLTVQYFMSNEADSKNVVPNLINVRQSPFAKIEISKKENTYRFMTNPKYACEYKWLLFDKELSACTECEYTFRKDGKYLISLLALSENGCVDSVSTETNVIIEHNILMPNAFTPDGDGNNDFFGPICKDLQEYEFEMKIFNKQGLLVFESKDINSHWDGRIQGSNRLAKQDVYIWKIYSKDKYNNVRTKMGNLNLILSN